MRNGEKREAQGGVCVQGGKRALHGAWKSRGKRSTKKFGGACNACEGADGRGGDEMSEAGEHSATALEATQEGSRKL